MIWFGPMYPTDTASGTVPMKSIDHCVVSWAASIVSSSLGPGKCSMGVMKKGSVSLGLRDNFAETEASHNPLVGQRILTSSPGFWFSISATNKQQNNFAFINSLWVHVSGDILQACPITKSSSIDFVLGMTWLLTFPRVTSAPGGDVCLTQEPFFSS